MKTIKILTTAVLISLTTLCFGQSNDTKPKENSSTETVTKIIRIKGANGEEKVITKQEVIKKQSKIKLNPDDEDKTNQSASYTDEEVTVQKSESSSDMEKYTKVADGEKGFTVTLLKKDGNQTSKIRPIGSGFYLVHMGEKDNCIGHFDKDQNLILQAYDPQADEIVSTIYEKK